MESKNKLQTLELGKEETHTTNSSTKDKLLVLMVIVLLLAVIVLMIFVAYLATSKNSSDQDFCLTPECTKAAARVLNSIDFSINPCDNFYEFACGGWIKSQPGTSWKSRYRDLRDEVALSLKNVLETKTPSNELEAVTKSKDLYQSCLNESLIEKRGLTPMIDMVTDFGGWPLLGNVRGGRWDESSFDLSALLIKVARYQRGIILTFNVYVDMKNSSIYILNLSQPWFGITREYLRGDINGTELQAYIKLAKSVALVLGADNTANLMEQIHDFISLESDLVNITSPSSEDVEEEYNKYDVGQLHFHFNVSKKMDFNWKEFIRGVFEVNGVTNIEMDEDEPIIVKDPLYYEKLSDVLDKYSKRTIANYVVWRIVKGRLWDMPNPIRTLLNEYKLVVLGRSKDPPRWNDCSRFVTNFLGQAAGRLFIQKTFDKESKSAMLEMIQRIKNVFKESLDNLDWIDESTKAVARKKSDWMKIKIGYEDFILNDEELNRKYENYTIHKDTYFENVLRLLNLRSQNYLRRLRKTVDKDKWDTPPSTVNAFYSFELNRIMFPAGILQPPYYHKDQPQSLNYGGIGFLIGHEITHGFDDVGRQYDKYGDVNQWWDEDVINKFKTRTQCFIEQYGNYSYPEAGGVKLNGKNTLGENIADNGAVKQCYEAYRKWVSENGKEEPQLPGVNLTHDQLLFVNIAQQRCTVANEKSARTSILTGVHSPARFRVIGTMQNYKEFSRVFNCPVGSYMNPTDTCQIW